MNDLIHNISIRLRHSLVSVYHCLFTPIGPEGPNILTRNRRHFHVTDRQHFHVLSHHPYLYIPVIPHRRIS